jgi:hypothetical protein
MLKESRSVDARPRILQAGNHQTVNNNLSNVSLPKSLLAHFGIRQSLLGALLSKQRLGIGLHVVFTKRCLESILKSMLAGQFCCLKPVRQKATIG